MLSYLPKVNLGALGWESGDQHKAQLCIFLLLTPVSHDEQIRNCKALGSMDKLFLNLHGICPHHVLYLNLLSTLKFR